MSEAPPPSTSPLRTSKRPPATSHSTCRLAVAAASGWASAFLAQHKLTGLAAPLSELGVEAPADLLDLDEDDVASLGLKKVQVKKWARAIASLKSTVTASARARTEL